MEKNGNTLSLGDRVMRGGQGGSKQASVTQGEVVAVDPELEMVRVKWAHGEEWVKLGQLERAT